MQGGYSSLQRGGCGSAWAQVGKIMCSKIMLQCPVCTVYVSHAGSAAEPYGSPLPGRGFATEVCAQVGVQFHSCDQVKDFYNLCYCYAWHPSSSFGLGVGLCCQGVVMESHCLQKLQHMFVGLLVGNTAIFNSMACGLHSAVTLMLPGCGWLLALSASHSFSLTSSEGLVYLFKLAAERPLWL